MENKRLKGNITTLDDVPRGVLVKILSRVACCSIEDLFNAKMCCKEWKDAGDDDLVYRSATVERLGYSIGPLWVTTEQKKQFLDRCRKSGNVDVMYREAMVQYFKGVDIEAGFQNLRRAAMALHDEARYVYSMILMCSDEEA
ncbi:F-box-like domain superfamily [Sesbania bispinosa]|nr:F-box-like domain superfamily [Sesbania bispinosa]